MLWLDHMRCSSSWDRPNGFFFFFFHRREQTAWFSENATVGGTSIGAAASFRLSKSTLAQVEAAVEAPGAVEVH